MAKFQFDSAGVEPVKEFTLLPEGDYTLMITSSEIKTTKAGTGQYLALTIEVVDGAYSGRKLWENINFDNPNPTAVKIAKQTLAGIMSALGLVSVNDTEELHDKPLVGKIKIKQRKDTGAMENVISSFKEASTGAAKEPEQAATAPAAVVASEAKTVPAPSWMK